MEGEFQAPALPVIRYDMVEKMVWLGVTGWAEWLPTKRFVAGYDLTARRPIDYKVVATYGAKKK